MKKLLFIALLLISTLGLQGQIHLLRYNDNFDYLKNDTVIKKGTENLKYLKLSENTTLSFGGEIREQFQYYDNLNFGDVPPAFSKSSTGQLWQRVMLHANLELGRNVRMFVQLGSTFRFFNPNPLTPEIDENRLSLHQAFLDYRFNNRWMLRLGRQEIFYGSHRLFTFREGPNTRLSFDAAVVKYTSGKKKTDVFILTPVQSREGVFDDKSFQDVIIGMYNTYTVVPKSVVLDYYSMSFHSNRRKYNHVSGKEKRQAVGIRLFSDNEKFNYELEAAYQTGKFNNQRIKAYGLATDVNYKLNVPTNFIIGLGSNYMSGDKNPNDNELNTYNTLFSKPPYGLTAPIGSSNLINVNPYVKLNPVKKLYVFGTAYFMWRHSNQDGTYSPGAVEIRPNPGLLFASTEKEIGTLLVLETNYTVNRHLLFGLDASRFFAGDYVKETGKGKNISYVSLKGVIRL